MSLCNASRVVVWTPVSACVRTMKSVNTRFPKPVHINRAKVLHFTRPIKPKDNRTMAEKCNLSQSKQNMKKLIERPASPIEEWAARQVLKNFSSSQLVAVFHAEGLTEEIRLKLYRRLNKGNMKLKVYNNRICNMAVQGTLFENMKPLFVGSNVFVVSEEASVKSMLKITDKVPRIHLLGGFVIDRLMSPEDMRNFSQLPSLPMVQGQLAGILSAATSRTYHLLQANQQRLSNNLSQLVKQGEEKKNDETDEGS
ncbi:large ribosomal subunit protein uL10m-like [Amphiura filiformis]|uniref:large ribosomal subunit protein uL10m-like n=1 Tax=Amphiura filiformis TaxID=82378 RepID=UPI003B217A36